MFRSTASRSLLRAPIASRQIRIAQARRFVSTEGAAPARKSRSWKSTALRWGLAAGAIYYYNTSTVFAEEPACMFFKPPSSLSPTSIPLSGRYMPSILATYSNQTSKHSCPPTTPIRRRRRLLPPNPRLNITQEETTRSTNHKNTHPHRIQTRAPRDPIGNHLRRRRKGCSHHPRRPRTTRGRRQSRRSLQSGNRRDQLGLPMSRWDGAWTLRGGVQDCI